MPVLVAQIAPQRSTQYSEMAAALAPAELVLSPLGDHIRKIEPLVLGDQEYLRVELDALPDEQQIRVLGTLAMTNAFFFYHDSIGSTPGPFLTPIKTRTEPFFSHELVSTRRYKGKTNELFTAFLLNVAKFSSGFRAQPWSDLRVLDPLAGGGTTLFAAFVLGAEVAGIEKSHADVESTATFVKGYFREEGIAFDLREETLKKLGHRWTFTVRTKPAKRIMLAHGDTFAARELVPGFKPHLIVTDLPYGIQHHGTLRELLTGALPIWCSMLVPEGAIVMSWDATRQSRQDLITLVESLGAAEVMNTPIYNTISHRVDRAIKQRDVLVVRPKARERGTAQGN